MIRSHRRNLRTPKFSLLGDRERERRKKSQPIETCNDVETCLYASVMTTINSSHNIGNANNNVMATVVAVAAMTKSAERNGCHYMAYTLFIYADDTA